METPKSDDRVFINGKVFQCLVCENPGFAREDAQLHSQLTTLFNVEWIGPTARCLICKSCGYIHWFKN